MSRKEGQKRKLLVLLEILARETDEKHPLSVPQLVEKLQEHGVVAERKSVYDDLNTLNNLPDTKYEIVQQRGRGGRQHAPKDVTVAGLANPHDQKIQAGGG